MWKFPKIRATLFWGPYNKDPTIWGAKGLLFPETMSESPGLALI